MQYCTWHNVHMSSYNGGLTKQRLIQIQFKPKGSFTIFSSSFFFKMSVFYATSYCIIKLSGHVQLQSYQQQKFYDINTTPIDYNIWYKRNGKYTLNLVNTITIKHTNVHCYLPRVDFIINLSTVINQCLKYMV